MQEARTEASALADLAIEWSIIGHLQTNKVRYVARVELPIEEGATVVRLGQAIFGPRPLPDAHYWPDGPDR